MDLFTIYLIVGVIFITIGLFDSYRKAGGLKVRIAELEARVDFVKLERDNTKANCEQVLLSKGYEVGLKVKELEGTIEAKNATIHRNIVENKALYGQIKELTDENKVLNKRLDESLKLINDNVGVVDRQVKNISGFLDDIARASNEQLDETRDYRQSILEFNKTLNKDIQRIDLWTKPDSISKDDLEIKIETELPPPPPPEITLDEDIFDGPNCDEHCPTYVQVGKKYYEVPKEFRETKVTVEQEGQLDIFDYPVKILGYIRHYFFDQKPNWKVVKEDDLCPHRIVV